MPPVAKVLKAPAIPCTTPRAGLAPAAEDPLLADPLPPRPMGPVVGPGHGTQADPTGNVAFRQLLEQNSPALPFQVGRLQPERAQVALPLRQLLLQCSPG